MNAKTTTHNDTYDIDAIIAALVGNSGRGYRAGGNGCQALEFKFEEGLRGDPSYVEAWLGSYVVLCLEPSGIAPESALTGLDLTTAAKCGARGVAVARPTEGPAWRRRQWELTIDGEYVGAYDTRREALAAAPTALAVFDWQADIRATLSAIPVVRRALAAQLAPGFATAAELVAAVVALCSEPAATAA